MRLARFAEDIGRNNPALVLANVCQRPDAGHVPNRPEPFTSAELCVDRNAMTVGHDVDRLQPDVGDPGAPAGGHQDAVATDRTGVVKIEDVVVAVASGTGDMCAQDELDAVPAQNFT